MTRLSSSKLLKNAVVKNVVAAAAAIAATTSLVLVPTAAFAAPTTTDDTVSSDGCQLGSRVIALWAHAPVDLKEDLRDLRGLTPEERREAAKVIKQGALDGKYGEGVQARAEFLRDRRVTSWAQMPDALQEDLRELAAAEPGERRDLATEIADTALAGGYGERTRLIAERVQERCGE